MPTKKVKYVHPVQFFPRSTKDLLKDDPTESQNVIIPLEPEHFKYGVFFNDGYNYMSHLVSLEDFNDETKDLQEIVKQSETKCNMLPTQSLKSATVIKEFEVNDDSVGNGVFDKMKEIAKDEIDEDILNALNSDAELSELEDDFVEIADTYYQPPSIKGDKDLFNRFLGNDNVDDSDDMENNDSTNAYCDFVSNIRKPINEISEHLSFDKAYNEFKQFRMSNAGNSSKCSTMSKSFLNAYERMKYKEENKEEIGPIDKSELFYESLYKGESEFNEKEVDKAVENWSFRKPTVATNAFDVNDKISKHQPKLMTIEKSKKRVFDQMDVDKAHSDDESALVFTNVSEFHVPRPLHETAVEKRERKKSIKQAKRARQGEKKVSRDTYKYVKSMI